MDNLLVSFSGGRTSALMVEYIRNHATYSKFNILVVFANTGKENEQTLEFVNNCDRHKGFNTKWIEAVVNPEKGKGTTYKQVTFETASRNGEPFEDVIRKYGIPSKMYRHCTRELKEVPIHKLAKHYFGGNNYITAIGIRADEKHRISTDPKKIYPLDSAGIDKRAVNLYWEKQSFNLELKEHEGNCDLCFLKSLRKKKTILKHNPSIGDWWNQWEGKTYSHGQVVFDVYRGMSINDLIEESKKPFQESVETTMQPTLFDKEYSCFCGSS